MHFCCLVLNTIMCLNLHNSIQTRRPVLSTSHASHHAKCVCLSYFKSTLSKCYINSCQLTRRYGLASFLLSIIVAPLARSSTQQCEQHPYFVTKTTTRPRKQYENTRGKARLQRVAAQCTAISFTRFILLYIGPVVVGYVSPSSHECRGLFRWNHY